MQANRPIDVWTNGFLAWLNRKLSGPDHSLTVKVLFATEDVWRELYETSQKTAKGSEHEYLGGQPTPLVHWLTEVDACVFPMVVPSQDDGLQPVPKERRFDAVRHLFPWFNDDYLRGLSQFDAVIFLRQTKLPRTTANPAQATLTLEIAAHEAVHILEVLHGKHYMSQRDPKTQWDDAQIVKWVKEYVDEKGLPF